MLEMDFSSGMGSDHPCDVDMFYIARDPLGNQVFIFGEIKNEQGTFGKGQRNILRNLADNLKDALSLEDNLLSGPMNFSKDMLLKNAECSPQDIKSALAMLFDESLDLAQRANDFIEQFNSIHEYNRSKFYMG